MEEGRRKREEGGYVEREREGVTVIVSKVRMKENRNLDGFSWIVIDNKQVK